MRTLLLLPLVLMLAVPGQDGSDGSSVKVVSFKWSKHRQVIVNPDNSRATPAKSAMIPANRISERNRKVNEQAGVRDPNLDTIDGRSAALEKSVQEARSPSTKPVDGFAYQVKVQNASPKTIEIVFWEYQFKELANPTNIVRRQFLCGVNIKTGKEKELTAFSVSGPSNMISVNSLANKSGNLFDEKIVINRLEYADGSIWQRKDWDFAEVRESISRALQTPWGAEMCRGL
jgi:hypothetical protein